MGPAATLFIVVIGALLAVPVAERLRIPHPVLCTAWGMMLALLPGSTTFHIAPDTMLALLLPPILYAAAQRTTWQQFVAHARPIVLLAVVLVFVTAAAVAVAATSIHPALPIGSAMVLAALVSPPDSAAAVSLAARLGLPRRLINILEGEGLFNDVTALILYQVAVSSVIAGTVTPAGVLGRFAYSIAIAIGIGIAVAWIATKLLDLLPTASARAGLSLLIPFAAYLPTAELHASGVMAVLVTALYLGHTRFSVDDATSRVTGRAFWDVVELLVVCLTFGLVGLELVTVIRAVGDQAYQLLGFAALICGVVIAIRVAWLLPLTGLARGRFWSKRRDQRIVDRQVPAEWRDTLVVSWAGMRGVVTLATALAIPSATASGAPFPGRDQILFVAVVVVLATLIVQGTTLPWLIEWLHVKVDPSVQRAAEQRVARIALDAALERLDDLKAEGRVNDQIAEHAADTCRALLADVFFEDEQAVESDVSWHVRVREVERELLLAARAAVIAARVEHAVVPDAADPLIHRLDLRTLTAE